MNSYKKYWNEEFNKIPAKKPKYDFWLDKHKYILDNSIKTEIVDLGCGLGNDSLYLTERGYKVIACDISDVAIKRVQEYIPNIDTRVIDLLEGLPFDESSINVIVADLCLHYFLWSDTLRIMEEISRILVPNGFLLCRLNSTNDINYGAGEGTIIEENYYAVNQNTKRFFTKEQVELLFSKWQILYIEENKIDRYKYPKTLWEAVVRNIK